LLLSVPKTAFVVQSILFFWQSMETQIDNFAHFLMILQAHKTKNYLIKFASLAVRAFLVCAISPLFATKLVIL
jgi:hypothetical protein